MFVEIPSQLLSRIATGSDRVPTLYYSRYWIVRKLFWMRLKLIYEQIKQGTHPQNRCLDFGGGGGVFLPTLSRYFKSVICIDLENEEARRIIAEYRLQNVELVQADISVAELNSEKFDAVVAADVLEHFSNLSVPVTALRKWLGENGVLYTSLPTENGIYVLLRKIFNITKPWDHYHTGYEVEDYLRSQGFKQIRRACVPLYWGLFPLFLIGAWKLDKAHSECKNG